MLMMMKSHFDNCSSFPSVLVAAGSQITRSGDKLSSIIMTKYHDDHDDHNDGDDDHEGADDHEGHNDHDHLHQSRQQFFPFVDRRSTAWLGLMR